MTFGKQLWMKIIFVQPQAKSIYNWHLSCDKRFDKKLCRNNSARLFRSVICSGLIRKISFAEKGGKILKIQVPKEAADIHQEGKRDSTIPQLTTNVSTAYCYWCNLANRIHSYHEPKFGLRCNIWPPQLLLSGISDQDIPKWERAIQVAEICSSLTNQQIYPADPGVLSFLMFRGENSSQRAVCCPYKATPLFEHIWDKRWAETQPGCLWWVSMRASRTQQDLWEQAKQKGWATAKTSRLASPRS